MQLTRPVRLAATEWRGLPFRSESVQLPQDTLFALTVEVHQGSCQSGVSRVPDRAELPTTQSLHSTAGLVLIGAEQTQVTPREIPR